MYKKLYKVRHGAKIDGVCGGLANYLNMDPTIIRLIWAAGTLFFGSGIIAYVVCSLVIPREPEYYDHNEFGPQNTYNNYQNQDPNQNRNNNNYR